MVRMTRMTWMAAALAAALIWGATAAQATPPLIYEGTLTIGGVVPDPWPALRFSLVDGAGMGHWESVVPPGGPIEVDPDGRFVAVLDSPVDRPFAAALGEERRLQVEVCAPRAGQGCDWVALGPPQVVGATPESARLIVDDIVLHVPGEFPSVQAALASLRGRLIMPGARVTIQVAPGSYPPAGEPASMQGIVIDRPDGDGIHIVGVPEAPQTVQLRFAETTGLTVQTGARLGGLSGVTLVGDRRGEEALVHGLHVLPGGLAVVGPGVEVDDFAGTCVLVVAGQLDAAGLATSSCADDGITATQAGTIRCQDCVAEGHGDYAMASTYHGYLRCYDCTIHGLRRGLIAHDKGLLQLRGGAVSVEQRVTVLEALRMSEVAYRGIAPPVGSADETSLIIVF